jgi:hypothetical protein
MKLREKNSRLNQLDRLLRWEGMLSNARIREVLGLSTIRVSECIREFRETHPSWLQLDTKTKSFMPTNDFYRSLHKFGDLFEDDATSLNGYLDMVSMCNAVMDDDDGRNVVWSAHRALGTPDPKTFSLLVRAAKEGKVIEVMYRSMNNPTPHVRTLSPHSVVRAGRRWHTRAYCYEVQEFRDFALGRIAKPVLLDESWKKKGKEEDDAWNSLVKVRLIAHPDLSREQAEIIQTEYFRGTAGMVETCRAALLSYFIQEMRVAIDVTKQTPPDYQIAVENAQEVSRWLFQK